MHTGETDTKTILAEKVRDILQIIRAKEAVAEETADLYIQLGVALNELRQLRTTRFGGKSS